MIKEGKIISFNERGKWGYRRGRYRDAMDQWCQVDLLKHNFEVLVLYLSISHFMLICTYTPLHAFHTFSYFTDVDE